MFNPQQGSATFQRPQSNRQGMIRTGTRGSRNAAHGLQTSPVGGAGGSRAQPARRFEPNTQSQLQAQANLIAALQTLSSAGSPGQSSATSHEIQGPVHDDTQLNYEEGPIEQSQGQHVEWNDRDSRMHIMSVPEFPDSPRFKSDYLPREERIGTLQLQVSYLMAKQSEDGGFAANEMASQGTT
ncbi:hypothetical protein Purlil1_12335 [Purpureocillium lilacinum]|uniref:Uncharacterized protein n=1 Tax=Purpureocillium lilacinum TaxID=33203 RepID=A0ABR0BH72_PURLI|nr:hypothetical protein Purlil1_12335 [Purpureocillium lilacinum]